MMLNFSKYTLYIVGCFLLVGCGESEAEKEKIIAYDASIIAPLVDAKTLSTTEIVPTLEHPLTAGKNAIYTPTLLYGWDEVRKKCNFPNEIAGENSESFKLFNRSESFKNVLDTSEYKTAIAVQEHADYREISAKAYFKKTLLFQEAFERMIPMQFMKNRVTCFGAEHLSFKRIDILYYKDDDNFLIKIPVNKETDEVFLLKGAPLNIPFADAILFAEEWTKKGAKEQENQKLLWKYTSSQLDDLYIPLLSFNIGSRDTAIQGQSFLHNLRKMRILDVYQETALTWNEEGAIVESRTEIMAQDSIASGVPVSESDIKPHPKHFIFNKPFYIFFRKKAQKNPYFAFKIEDTAFMSVGE
jgi:Serpin (serine protease inhibitor)